MRVPLGWLSEWIDLPNSVEDLEERLTMGGLEIEEILRTGPDLSGLRVGHVLEHSRHPDADRLSVCRIDLGAGAPLELVCGAQNVAAGQKVAVATVGTVLPGDFKIKKSRIRGVDSRGMICSVRCSFSPGSSAAQGMRLSMPIWVSGLASSGRSRLPIERSRWSAALWAKVSGVPQAEQKPRSTSGELRKLAGAPRVQAKSSWGTPTSAAKKLPVAFWHMRQ